MDDYNGNPDLGYSDGETYYIVQGGIGQPLLSHTTSVYSQGGGSVNNSFGYRLGDFTTSLRPAAHTTHASAYPNPTTDKLTISTSGTGHATITVHTLDGREVLRERTTTGAQKHVLSMHHLLPGSYLLRVEEGGSTRTERVVRM